MIIISVQTLFQTSIHLREDKMLRRKEIYNQGVHRKYENLVCVLLPMATLRFPSKNLYQSTVAMRYTKQLNAIDSMTL
jgi:hypothetical protein